MKVAVTMNPGSQQKLLWGNIKINKQTPENSNEWSERA